METNEYNSSTVTVSDEFQHKDGALTNMIFGIVSIVISSLPVLSIGSIVFGALAISRSRKNKVFALEKGIKENGMNVAGFVTGIIGTVSGALMTLLYLFIILAGVLFAVNFAASSAPAAIGDLIGSAIDGAAASGSIIIN